MKNKISTVTIYSGNKCSHGTETHGWFAPQMNLII